MRLLRFIGRCGAFAALFAVLSASARAADASPAFSVSAVKAAYLVNFAKFGTWSRLSDTSDAPLVIGVVEDREVEEYIFKLAAGQKIDGHPVRVKRILREDELAACQIIYFGTDSVDEVKRMLATLGRDPVLTVSSDASFLPAGGMISFYSDNNSLRFEIDATAVEAAGVKLSSRLLALARPNPARSSKAP